MARGILGNLYYLGIIIAFLIDEDYWIIRLMSRIQVKIQKELTYKHKREKMNRAERRRRQKLERRSHPSLLHGAIAHHQAGRLQEAEEIYRHVLAADPENIDACHLLGVIGYQTGKNEIAIELISKAIDLDSREPHFHNNLGNAFFRLGRLDKALEAYQKAVSIKPDFPEAHENLGNVLSRQGRLDEAVESYHNALRIRPDYPEALNHLGTALYGLGRLDETIQAYQDALKVRPDYAEVHNHLGNVLAEKGRRNEAAASFKKAINYKPGYGEAYRHLAQVRRHSERDPIVDEMLKTYSDPHIADDQRMHLAFGLGKVFEDLGDFEKSFDFILEGNRLKRSTYAYDPEKDREFFRDLKGVFTGNLFHKHGRSGYRDRTPIFIVGMMRSGSSLVEQILASHPQVHGAGEVSDFEQGVIGRCETLTGARFPHGLDRLGAEDLQMLGHDYTARIRRYSGARRITDKMLYNFMYVGLIQVILPEAKIIHCQRDPVDTCLSIFKNFFTGVHEYAYDLEELGGYYNLYQEWMEYLEGLLPGYMFHIRYEDIIADQEGETRRMLEYCGLPWDDACLSFHRTARPVRTASSEQVKRPIYNSSVGLWRRYEKGLGPLLETLRISTYFSKKAYLKMIPLNKTKIKNIVTPAKAGVQDLPNDTRFRPSPE